LAQKCNAKYIQIPVDGNANIALNNKDKHVLCLEAAPHEEQSENPLSTTFSFRSPFQPALIDKFRSIDILAAQLTALTSFFPSHLVALSGVPSLRKRKTTLGSLAVDEAFATASPTSTPRPAESYRLLTPPLILSLGIVFGFVVPLVLVVISAVAGIKSSVRETAGGKSRIVGSGKKNQ
jgi:hypothetical protein